MAYSVASKLCMTKKDIFLRYFCTGSNLCAKIVENEGPKGMVPGSLQSGELSGQQQMDPLISGLSPSNFRFRALEECMFF